MVTFCISCWPPETGTGGLLHSLACTLTCPWFLFNSHEAMTRNKAERETQTKKRRKKRNWQQDQSPTVPKEIRGSNHSEAVKRYGCIRFRPPSWFCIPACLHQDKRPWLEVSNFTVLDRSKVTNGSHCWKKVTFKHSARQWGGILPWLWLLNHCQGN